MGTIDLVMRVLGKDFMEACRWLASDACITLSVREPAQQEQTALDVSRYEQEVENIAAGLAALDPEHADAYRGNTDAYVQRLDALKEKVKELKGRGAGKKIIIFHDAFAYFADASGMKISYVIDMDENTSLSANMVSELVELVRADDIDLLFAEAQYGTKIADAVSRETGAKVYVLDSLVTGDMDKDSYIRGMEENLRILEEALKEE